MLNPLSVEVNSPLCDRGSGRKDVNREDIFQAAEELVWACHVSVGRMKARENRFQGSPP